MLVSFSLKMKTNMYILPSFVVLCISTSLAIFCPDIAPIQHGDVRSTSRPPYRNGAIVTFTCDRGYKRNGLGSIRCSNGRWSNPVPYCSVIRCRRNLTKVEEGRTCRKSCKSDIDCNGIFKKCLCDDWCGKTCFNPYATCPQLTAPENGYIIQSQISYGYTVTYGCDEGYVLTGLATRRCQANKKWSGHEPKCVEFATCGQAGDEVETLFKAKVIEGKNASEGAWPWQTLLFHNLEHNATQIYNRTSGFAGGSIIDDEWILTVAHISKIFPNIDENKNPEASFLIAVGLTTFPQYGQVLPQYVNIFEPKKVYINENFNSKNYDYDVALIRIGKRLKRERGKFVIDQNAPDGKLVFSRYIRPVCLPCMKGDKFGAVDIWKNFDKDKCNPKGRSSSNAIIKAGEFVMVTGFGWKRNPGEFRGFRPMKLQEGLLKIADDLLCIKSVREIRKDMLEARYTDRMLCASSASENARTDSCQGDSGGPLVKQMDISDHFKCWIQVGIVSWGGKCGSEHPGFYTSVMTIMSWVWEVIDETRTGTWNNWSQWSTCSMSCGRGVRRRMRACRDKNCPGPSVETENCNTLVCPVFTGTTETWFFWSRWSTWTTCSRTCGVGMRYKERLCVNSENCPGPNMEEETCNTLVCPVWSRWSTWTTCSRTCGVGIRHRRRICVNGENCPGPNMEEETCNTLVCPVFTGTTETWFFWSRWSAWTTCSRTCGVGMRYRGRLCVNSENCQGSSEEFQTCNTLVCPNGKCGSGNICL